MQHEPDAASAARWIEHAKGDLSLARICLPPGVPYELLCFHAQQAAEKAIKAVLIHHGIDFPYTHNIQRLVELLPTELLTEKAFLRAALLTPFAVMARYPGETEPVSREDYTEAVALASAVVHVAEKIIIS